ncbi:MAG: alpha/beta hydrolase [Spirochaetales bacterium]|nr:alpha/beta hydrolase [Spirochaetales bacterium]
MPLSHDEITTKISRKTKLFNLMFRIIKPKTFLNKLMKNPSRSKKDLVPKKIYNNFNVTIMKVLGKSVVTIQPKKNIRNKHIIYLHGGAYVLEGMSMHWDLIKKIIDILHVTVTYIDYPLAPEHSYKETHEMVRKAYDMITKIYAHDEFILMGDSAGGGLCLSVIQKLRDDNVKVFPQKTVLFSPWVDVSMKNPHMKDIEDIDGLLSVTDLVIAASSYAHGDDMNQSMLSPVNGAMHDLGEIALFVGTHEIFLFDCRELKTKIEATNTKVAYFEYQGMQHDWILFPLSETKDVIKKVCDFIQSR